MSDLSQSLGEQGLETTFSATPKQESNDSSAGDSAASARADIPDEEDGDDDKQKERRKIEIKFIQDKSRRHITFSKRKFGIMKKAYELSVLTGTQVLLLVVSETGLVYTFTTPKLQPLVTKPEGKSLIQACLNAPDEQDGEEEQEEERQDAHVHAQSQPQAQLHAASVAQGHPQHGIPRQHMDGGMIQGIPDQEGGLVEGIPMSRVPPGMAEGAPYLPTGDYAYTTAPMVQPPHPPHRYR